MKTKILIWPTTFGADLWSLTKYLDGRDDTEIKVVMEHPQVYQSEPVAKLFELKAQILERGITSHLTGASGFEPHVTIIDNRVPMRSTSKKGFVLWHGFGWKGPNDVQEFSHLHSTIKRAWGSGMEPNENFRWQTFGPWDFEHRTKVSGFHPDNCRMLGAASHDDLCKPLDKNLVKDLYPFDIINKKTVLIAPTWHYGEVFAHWGSDAELFERLILHIENRGANVVLRLHDSFRFERKYRNFLNDLVKRHPSLILKFKDKNPDNYLDLQVADVLITNFSSIANLFYGTRRPTIHVYPVADADQEFMWRRYTPFGVLKSKKESARFIWKLPPEENGGLLAMNFEEVIKQVDQALDDPDCCKEKVEAFLQKHMLGADGKNCERIWKALCELIES